jgi:phosphatidylcholine synthase
MTTHTLPPPTLFQKTLAWGVHAFTATGAIWALLSILAIQHHQWKLLFLWIALSLLVDGFDGFLARRFHTKEYASGLDGALLDNMIDYLNYVVVPAYFLIEAQLVPPASGLVVASLILLSSAYQFSQTDAKTDDHYFKGFPDYWNILAVYLFLMGWSLWFNLAIFLICVVLVFVPIKYIYPSRTTRDKTLTQVLCYIWGAMGAVAIILYPNNPAWIIWLSLVIVAIYLIMSVIHTLRPANRTPSGNGSTSL